MEVILLFAVSFCVAVIGVLLGKIRRQDRQLEQLTEQIERFLNHTGEALEENLQEGYTANFHNEIAKLEKQLLLERERRADRECEIGNFVENIAHQMMNTVTALQIQTDLLQISPHHLSEKNVAKIEQCVERMKTEIDRILKSGQLAAGKIHMIYETLRAGEEVETCMAKLPPLAEKKAVKVRLECEKSCEFPGDPFWFSQALENIMKNAIEHTPNETTVLVTVLDKKREVCIRVEDEGEGMRAEQQAQLFTRYARGMSKKQGYGIGLSMAKDIVQAHHGTLEAGNRVETGAWFEIRIPVLEGAKVYEETEKQSVE